MSTPYPASFHKWHRRADAAPGSPDATPTAKAASGGALTVPPESDVQEGAIRASQPGPRPMLKGNYTPDGTYIPLSGGSRGWFENSGVPAQERMNGYQLDSGVDGDAFRRTILERIETFNRRGAVRHEVKLWVAYSDPSQEGADMTERGFCVDMSVTGAKLRLRRAVAAESFMAMQFYRTPEDLKEAAPVATVLAQVTHCEAGLSTSSGTRYYAGVHFQELDIRTKETLALLAAEGNPIS